MGVTCRFLSIGVLHRACLSVAGCRNPCSSNRQINWIRQFRTVANAPAVSSRPVNLTYDVFDGKGDKTPLVFLHGLFGSKSNFQSIAKSLVQRTDRKVLTIDARNHGKSTHSPVLTYEAMTNDLTQLLAQLRIGKCILIGHSMGGKVAMTTALTQPALVERLVVVDISPAPTAPLTNFPTYIQAMKDVKVPSNVPRSTARRLAEDQLRDYVKERSVRQFLLTNLIEEEGQYSWRINLEAIANHLGDIKDFPKFNNSYEGPTLFLGGTNSAYISSEDYPEIQRLFPCADIQYIPDASHWIHADKPLDFISSLVAFLQS
ncbi:sn-1-specific diacylglycerol lipase ABHD11 isoform X2 [Engraulis encrasicolus]|uniref:sn-1-specific diacylglycerol lipase ABHD11 isoform X2 n=1 Tax=Engraulis encrasicolus TaxID=184585 RepID=UPI002FCF6E39